MGPPGAPGLHSLEQLDDALLLNVFASMSLQEVLSSAALVCRRWRALSTSPTLHHTLEVHLPHASSMLPRLRSLLLWLLRHSVAPRSLTLCLCQAAPVLPPSESAAEIVALLNSCATMCTSAERLTIVHNSGTYCPNGWLVASRCLRRVCLRSRVRLHLLTTLEGLTALQDLELSAPSILLAPGARLPPSLTSLVFAGDRGPHMPHQLGELSALRSLHLAGVGYDSGGFEVLRRLHSLRSLHLERCRLPACLRALTGLQALRLSSLAGQTDGELAAGVDATLRALGSQLTSLALLQLPPAAACPPALAALRRVQELALVPAQALGPASSAPAQAGTAGLVSAAGPAAAAVHAAAAVPWPPSLRRLTTTFELAHGSLAWLARANLLRHLCLVDSPVPSRCPSPASDGGAWVPPPEWAAFWRWAVTHLPLTCMEFPMEAAPGQAWEQEALSLACQHIAALRPGLRILTHLPTRLRAHAHGQEPAPDSAALASE